MLIIGDKEEKTDKVAVRLRDAKDLGEMRLESFIKRVKTIIDKKSLNL